MFRLNYNKNINEKINKCEGFSILNANREFVTFRIQKSEFSTG